MASKRREVVDGRRRAFAGEAQRLVALVCGCGNLECHRAVLLALSDYDELRAAGGVVVVDPSHEPPRVAS